MTDTTRDQNRNLYPIDPLALPVSTNPLVDTNSCTESHIKIEKMLASLKQSNTEIRQEFESLALSVNQSLKRIEDTYQKAENIYRQINDERLNVIGQLKMALIAYRLASIGEKIKSFWRPRIGKLNQYPARPLVIKKQYQDKIPLINTPTISLVTPSFNQGEFIERTILSVIEQKYPALEYIIQDGGSNDNTQEVIQKYASSLKYWDSQKDNGQSHALNLGFEHATGEIMAYLNSDDILLPGTLAYVANYFTSNPNIDVIYGHRILIDEHDHEIGRWVLPPHNSKVLKWADYIPQETLFWRKSIWDKAGAQIDESFKFAMDWDLLLRFQKAGARFARLPRFLGAFRIHSHQKTSAQISKVGVDEMHRLRTRSHGRQVSHIEIKRNIIPYLIKHIIFHKLYKIGILRY
ncbi:MAG: glycosyltransferase family 2 protein [Gammaproteobacteria bacterium]|nr:glycosyltransferase family 2 protein [Gammaproteobacteria bacterium]